MTDEKGGIPMTKLVQIRVDEELWQKIQELASRYRLPVNAWVGSLILKAVSRQVREAWAFSGTDPPPYVADRVREYEAGGGSPVFLLTVYRNVDAARVMDVEVAAKIPGEKGYQVLTVKGLREYDDFKIDKTKPGLLWVRGSGFWAVREIVPLTFGAHVRLEFVGKKWPGGRDAKA